MGSEQEIRGAEAVACAYEGRARAIAPALPGAVWRHRGAIKVVFVVDVGHGLGLTVLWWADPPA